MNRRDLLRGTAIVGWGIARSPGRLRGAPPQRPDEPPDGPDEDAWSPQRILRIAPRAIIPCGGRQVHAVALGDDGAAIAAVVKMDDFYRVWDADGREKFASDAHSGRTMRLAFRPGGKSVISSSARGHLSQEEPVDPLFVRATDVATGRQAREMRTRAAYLTGLAVTRKETAVAIDVNDVMWGWDLASGNELFSIKAPSDRRPGGAFPPVQSSFAAGADGRRLAALSGEYDERGVPINRVVILWDADRGACRTLAVQAQPLRSVALSPDGSVVLVATVNQNILAFDFASEKRLYSFYPGEGIGGEGPFFLAFSPDGSRFVMGRKDGLLRMYESQESRYIGMIRGPRTYIRAVAFLPDRLRIVSGGYERAGVVRTPDDVVVWKYEPLWVWDAQYRKTPEGWKGFRQPDDD